MLPALLAKAREKEVVTIRQKTLTCVKHKAFFTTRMIKVCNTSHRQTVKLIRWLCGLSSCPSTNDENFACAAVWQPESPVPVRPRPPGRFPASFPERCAPPWTASLPSCFSSSAKTASTCSSFSFSSGCFRSGPDADRRRHRMLRKCKRHNRFNAICKTILGRPWGSASKRQNLREQWLNKQKTFTKWTAW